MLQPQQLIQVPGPTDGLAVGTSKTSNIGSLVQYNTGSPPSTIDTSPVLEIRQEHKNVGGGSRGKAAKLFTVWLMCLRGDLITPHRRGELAVDRGSTES
jgi:hypothetical protein